jgi:hypothetical protein
MDKLATGEIGRAVAKWRQAFLLVIDRNNWPWLVNIRQTVNFELIQWGKRRRGGGGNEEGMIRKRKF